jgi:uncharacterized protein YbcI
MPDIQEHEDQQQDYQQGRGEIASRISTGAVQLLSEYTGRGPTKAHTILNRDSVTIVLQDTLTKGERSLAAKGKQEEVLHTRHAYQQVMRNDLTQLVEQAVGRNVTAFMSANHIDPDTAVEFFLLEASDGEVGGSSSEGDGTSH